MTSLFGKHAAITGGAGGIGQAVARRFLDAGASVSLIDLDPVRLEAAVQALGGAVTTVVADVSQDADCRRAVREIEQWAGRAIDILVNNAGVVLRGVPVAEIAPETWDWIMGVNFFGAVNMVRAALPAMRALDDGHVITIGSISGFVVGTRQSGAYAASKFALTAYVEALAADLAGSGIGVSLVAPAGVSTRLYDNSAASRTGPVPTDAIDTTPADTAAAMAPEVVADHVMDAIRTRQLFVMTHAETRDWIEDRHRQVLGGFAQAPERAK